MSVLAGSLIADLSMAAANAVVGRSIESTPDVQASAVAEATARHSRMVAHEIRNMLVPVKTALGALYREVLMAEHPGEVVSRRSQGIDRGIDSVFRFIEQLVELSRYAATPPEAFDLLQAMNTGHDGSMGTLHANSPREAISRVESMITMGGYGLPHCLRVTIGTAEECGMVEEALAAFVRADAPRELDRLH